MNWIFKVWVLDPYRGPGSLPGTWIAGLMLTCLLSLIFSASSSKIGISWMKKIKVENLSITLNLIVNYVLCSIVEFLNMSHLNKDDSADSTVVRKVPIDHGWAWMSVVGKVIASIYVTPLTCWHVCKFFVTYLVSRRTQTQRKCGHSYNCVVLCNL